MTETQAWDSIKCRPTVWLHVQVSTKNVFYRVQNNFLFFFFKDLWIALSKKSQFERILFKNVIIMINGKTSKSEQCLNVV